MLKLNHLGQIPEHAAKKFGDKEALFFEGEVFTFNDLYRLINQFASGLAQSGVKQGDVVTLYATNSWQWVVAYYAIARIGGIINPANTMLTSKEIEYVTSDCKASAIIVSEDLIEPALSVRDKVNVAICLGDAQYDGLSNFNDMLRETPPADVSVDTNSLSTICYTSGTTGHPKGAMQSHRSVLLQGAMTCQYQHRTENDVMVTALPCPHVYGTVIMNAMMMYGAKMILQPRFDPILYMQAVQNHKGTIMDGVPTMYMYMLNQNCIDKIDFSSVTRAYVGGQSLPVANVKQVEEKINAPLMEIWGMTEMAGLGTTHPLYGPQKYGSVGCALPYCEIRIAPVDDPNKTLPIGEIGELLFKGPLNMMGYYNNEEKTRETMTSDGWLRTGDTAYMDEDNCTYIVDRLKDVILTGGFNIYPAEIERVLAMHPAVALSAVGRKTDDLKGEIAKAYIVLRDGHTPSHEDIIKHCRNHLAAYKCPREIQYVADVPKTSTGKIMRRQLYTLDED